MKELDFLLEKLSNFNIDICIDAAKKDIAEILRSISFQVDELYSDGRLCYSITDRNFDATLETLDEEYGDSDDLDILRSYSHDIGVHPQSGIYVDSVDLDANGVGIVKKIVQYLQETSIPYAVIATKDEFEEGPTIIRGYSQSKGMYVSPSVPTGLESLL